MHSFLHRANALATFSVTILAIMCGIASLSDNFHVANPVADVKISKVNWFRKLPRGNDEVSLTLNISADLESLFTWNTKQVFVFVAAEYATSQNGFNQISLWDRIIQEKEHAKFQIITKNQYRLVDQGSNLRDREFNLTMHWHVMPKTGKMSAGKIVMTGYRLPESFR